MTYTLEPVSQHPDEPRTLTTKLYAQIRHEILTCALHPGERLRIAFLQERFAVSLSAVREALSRLVSEGLIKTTDQKGFHVAPVSMPDLIDLMRTRGQIESLALSQSIEAGDLSWEARVIAAYHTLSRLPRAEPASPLIMSEAWARAHADFHVSLVSACDSPWLLRFRSTLYEQTERYRRLTVYAEPSRDVLGEHREMMTAAIKRDKARALAIYETHIGETARILIRHFVHPARADGGPRTKRG